MDEDSVGRALARAAMAHRGRAAELLARIELHPGQEFLLAALANGGEQAVGELAEALGVEQPTVTKMVRRLEPSGLVARGPDPDDGRRTLVRLTPAGSRRHAAATSLWERLDDEATADLTDAEAAALRRLLDVVRQSLEDR